MAKYRVLTINPGSTSTKVAVFDDETEVFSKNIVHAAEDLAGICTADAAETISGGIDFRSASREWH